MKTLQEQPIIEIPVLCPFCFEGVKEINEAEFYRHFTDLAFRLEHNGKDFHANIDELREALRKYQDEGVIVCPECQGAYQKIKRR